VQNEDRVLHRYKYSVYYISFREGPDVAAREFAFNIVFDLDAAGLVIGIEIEHASRRVDLQQIQFSVIPFSQTL
jgi:uncharacterized protein YuzE